jgi:hypothetical protein
MFEPSSQDLPFDEGDASAGEVSPAPAVQPPAMSGQRGLLLQAWAVLVAVLGGGLGVVGAFLNELLGGIGLISAPLIEEVMKPAGVLLLLACWPRLVGGRLHTAALAMLGGLTFALIEALIYTEVYYPDSSADFVRYRFTAPIAMHVLASCIVGLGLDRGIVDWAAGRGRIPRHTRNLALAAMALHLAFNLTAWILTLTGDLKFDRV